MTVRPSHRWLLLSVFVGISCFMVAVHLLQQLTRSEVQVKPPARISFKHSAPPQHNHMATAKMEANVDNQKQRTKTIASDSALQTKSPWPKSKCISSFFIIGSRKGGTTSLYNYLAQHPNVKGINLDKGPAAGETDFFSHRFYQIDFKKYVALFKPIDLDRQITGEASVSYLVHGDAPRRVRKLCGDRTKFIALLREPVDRFHSQFLMRVRLQLKGHNNETSLEWSVSKSIRDFMSAEPKNRGWWRNPNYAPLFAPSKNGIYEGLYVVHLHRWMSTFSPRQFLVLKSEDFFADPSNELIKAMDFLGLDTSLVDVKKIAGEVFNSRGDQEVPSHQVMTHALRGKLNAIFGEYNADLSAYLNHTRLWFGGE